MATEPPKDICNGKFKLESSEKFDEFLQEVGVSFLLRKFAQTATPTVEVTKKDDNNYTIRTVTTLKTTELVFCLGKEFEETRIDGVTVKTIITRNGNTFLQKQMSDKPVEITREFTDTQMIVTCKCGKVASIRKYKRL
ncbi:fatty acid-binding protein FABP-like protein [Leptotrombidium deliense]|uniref:Fatty acid-binding protein FABP-like protein n=1 Tax=Leptotrombidium deliense TaxID=299467 RepID=A0A443S6B7_9ACAR|nr:fatty acid-binding protein FABP-like protein [Leptotrombidium deliense]